ncbi:MAG: hypothetical protein E7678_04670 [Ruminococcaceae bacterium]|nr:hypothetical protein [Oscillospiraceae bacterium]
MNNRQSLTISKDFRLDKLRAISCIMVVIIHVANYYGRAFHEITPISYLAVVISNAICRVSVPIFFMISGMLLLKRPVDLKKNAKRILEKFIYSAVAVIVVMLWDIFYMKVKFKNFIGLLGTPERSLLWFLYAIIGLYIALPFIRRMVENMTNKEDLLFVVLWVVFNGVVHLLKYRFKIEVSYPVPIINGTYYLGYFVMGHLIAKHNEKIKGWLTRTWVKLLAIAFGIASCLATITLSYLKALESDKFFYYFFGYKSLFIIISSVIFFVLFYNFAKNKENKIISSISKHSFEIYLFHAIVLDFVMTNVNFVSMNSFLGIPLYSVVVFIGTYLPIALIKGLIGFLGKKKKSA